MARSPDRKPKSEYHHGNLRRALLDETARMLAEVDPDAISLRELARQLGVDHRAAYRHFADRETLLAEVADEGYLSLIAKLEAGLARAPATAIDRLLAFARVYVDQSLREPGRYRAMIRPRVVDSRDRPADSGDAALALLEAEVIAGVQRGELIDEDPRELAVGLWSTMHGLASLIATRRLYVRPALALAYTSRVFQRSVRGITTR